MSYPASVCVRNPKISDSSFALILTRGLGNDDFSFFVWGLNRSEHIKSDLFLDHKRKTLPFSPSTIQLILLANMTKLLSFLLVSSSSSSASEKVRNLLMSSCSSFASLTLPVWKSVNTKFASEISFYLLVVGLHRVNCHGVCPVRDHDLFVFVGYRVQLHRLVCCLPLDIFL